jgi:hypothetical protein
MVAIVVAAVALRAIARSHRRGAARHSVAPWTTVCLVAAGFLGAAGWRIGTSGAVGANIGADMVLLTWPVLISALLVAAVVIEYASRGRVLRHAKLLILLAVLVAPLLYAVQSVLIRYDAS